MDGLWAELERIRRRREIKAKIREIRKEIQELNEIIQYYEKCGTMINEHIEAWNNQYRCYQSLELAPDIKVVNSFEGVSADYFAGNLPQMIEDIQSKAGKMAEVAGGIGEQTAKITEYIEKLNKKIEALEEELASI